jgi:hypothetical protein
MKLVRRKATPKTPETQLMLNPKKVSAAAIIKEKVQTSKKWEARKTKFNFEAEILLKSDRMHEALFANSIQTFYSNATF